MSYYIATDKFGNFDLRHYGVKGMKWGEVHEDEILGTNQRRADSTPYEYRIHNSSMPSPVKTISTSKPAEKTEEKTSPKTSSGDPDLDAKVADAEAKYKEALTSMQMMARISLSQGFSPNSDPDYISARKAVIKAKYELDKLRLDQQVKVAKEPAPTYAEQKQIIDNEAKQERKEAKENKKTSSLDDIYAKQKETLDKYGRKTAKRW